MERLPFSMDEQAKLWSQMFPRQICWLRALVANSTFVSVYGILYGLFVIATLVYSSVYIIKLHEDMDAPISFLVLLHIQAVMFVFMPLSCYWFVKKALRQSGLSHLLEQTERVDGNIKFKFAIVTHGNFIWLLLAALGYIAEKRFVPSSFAVLPSTLIFLLPLNIAVSLAVCIIELHRVKIHAFLAKLEHKIADIDAGKTAAKNKRRDVELADIEMKFNSQDATDLFVSSSLVENEIKEWRGKYISLYDEICETSNAFGMYFLVFLCYGFVYTATTIYGLYVGEYIANGIIAFALLGLFTVFEVGTELTIVNETGMALYYPTA